MKTFLLDIYTKKFSSPIFGNAIVINKDRILVVTIYIYNIRKGSLKIISI